MRQLTVTRRKKFVASLAKIKFYIEDPENGDTDITGVRTRKLLELKNGDTQSVEIGDNAARLFAIAGPTSKDWCVDVYNIPEGSENIELTGQNMYNPANGNAFRFDGNDDDPETKKIRNKGNKRGFLILIIAILIGAAVGALVTSMINIVRPKTFTKDGLSITLDTSFKEDKEEPFNAVYLSKKRGVGVMTSKSEFPKGSDVTLYEYCDMVMESAGLPSGSLKKDGDKYYFEYDFTNPDNKITYHYRVYALQESTDTFWLINFYSIKSAASKMESKYKTWVSSVKFD